MSMEEQRKSCIKSICSRHPAGRRNIYPQPVRPMRALSLIHISLIELIKTGTHGARRDFSSGRSAVIDRDHVCFHQASALAAQPENEYFYELHEGENKLTEINCMAYLCRQALPAERLEVYSNIYKKSIHIVMNSDKIKRVYPVSYTHLKRGLGRRAHYASNR